MDRRKIMIKSRYLFSNISILNLLLTVFISFMAFYTLLPQLSIDTAYTLPDQKKTADIAFKEAPSATQTSHSLSDYMMVAEDNLFHPERKIPPEKKAEEAPLPKPDFVAYGSVITESTRIAFLEDLKAPRTTTGRGRRQIAVREGDIFSGFTVKEVGSDKVVLARGEDRMSVPVRRDKSKKEASAPAGKAASLQAAELETQKPSPAGLPPKTLPPAGRRAPMTRAEEGIQQFFRSR
jgi:hypothetical protein